jgi:methionyl aminopeptidase
MGPPREDDLHEGLVLAIVPFLSTRARWVHQGPDGWSLCAADDSRCAQFEHTVVVQSGEPIILTAAA